MYVCKKYTFGILIFVSDCIIVYYGCFSVCKDLCTSFSNDMQGMFLYVQNVRETFISVSICRRSCIYPACRFLYAGVLGSPYFVVRFFYFPARR